MGKGRVLFVDDDKAGRRVALYHLREEGYDVDEAESGEHALDVFDAKFHDLVITDIRMPGISGIDLLREIRKRSTDIPVIIITAYASIDEAVEAMKLGAYDFVVKPFDGDLLLRAVSEAIEYRWPKKEDRALGVEFGGAESSIVCCSEAVSEIASVVARATGSGVDKRATRSVFSGTLGTISLYEVGNLPEGFQAKLLQLLQEYVIDAEGDDESAELSVLIIAAANKDLDEEAL